LNNITPTIKWKPEPVKAVQFMDMNGEMVVVNFKRMTIGDSMQGIRFHMHWCDDELFVKRAGQGNEWVSVERNAPLVQTFMRWIADGMLSE